MDLINCEPHVLDSDWNTIPVALVGFFPFLMILIKICY